MSSPFEPELEERLVRYARIDTTSDEGSASTPSTEIVSSAESLRTTPKAIFASFQPLEIRPIA